MATMPPCFRTTHPSGFPEAATVRAQTRAHLHIQRFDARGEPAARVAECACDRCRKREGRQRESTLSINITIALLKAGCRVASIDLDTRQQTFTRFLENRLSWAGSAGLTIEMPLHHAPQRGASPSVADNEAHEFAMFAEAVSAVEHDFEFLIIDTPASDSYMMRLAHSLADTLVTPVNDSFIDVDVLSRVQHDRARRGMMSHYAELVTEARRRRRQADAGLIDWVLVRNRVASIQSNNARQVATSLTRLAVELQFRQAEGLHDRVIFRELFPIGLTPLDAIEEASRTGTLTASQSAARQEVAGLIDTLQLPRRDDGSTYIEARHAWFQRISHLYAMMRDKDPPPDK